MQGTSQFIVCFGYLRPQSVINLSPYDRTTCPLRMLPFAKFDVGSTRGDVETDMYFVLGSFDQMLNVIVGYNENNHQLEQVGREPAPWTAHYQLRQYAILRAAP